MASDEKNNPLFREINADDENPEVTELESLCVQCEENGTTRILLTKIPFFKEVIIMSFECPHCGWKNNEIQPGSKIQEKGVRLTLKVKDKEMLNRQVVKQRSAMYRINEVDFEAPPFGSKGELTTLEGLLSAAADDLQTQQPVRKVMQPELAAKIDDVIQKIEELKSGDTQFTFVLEDISGNSFLENPFAPNKDPCLTDEWFVRTKEQNEKLGIFEEYSSELNEETSKDDGISKDEVLEFATNCSSCQAPAKTKMKLVAIPHFKEIIIMATDCEACGYKTNEVKAGGAIEEKGTKITFKMTHISDLSRDVLTSETCIVHIPELDLQLNHSSMGGRFTTLEGLVENVKEQLGKANPFEWGDSGQNQKFKSLLSKLDQIAKGDLLVTVILDDPVGNSYLQNTYAPDPDPEMTVEKYERTVDQNDELGLSDMRTENYT